MLFNVFKLIPLSRIATYLLVVLSTIGHFIFILKPKMFSKSIKFWYYIGIVTMLISMTTGYLYYSQSFFAGFVANSNFYNVGSVILCVYLFLKNDISLSRLFSLLIKVSWVNLGLIAFMAITNFAFINESELTGNIVVVHAGKISKNLTNLIAIYWLSLYLFKSNYKYLLFSLLFFAANHFYDLQRVIFLVTLLVIGIGILKMRKFKAARKVVIPALFSIVFVSIFLFNSIQGATIFKKFIEASKVFTEDSNSIDDSSAAIRVYEVGIALNKFKQHPLFGNGYFRASDAEKVIGKDVHFYISDIGIFGILFSLGIFGVVLFLKQIKLVWKLLMSKQNNQYQFIMVLALIFLLSQSLVTGSSINHYDYFFLLIAMLQLSTHSITRINDKM
jgi:hypothetical protein